MLVKPFCCGFYDGKSLLVWWGGDCIRDLLNHVRKRRIVLYFHNMGRFDLWQLLTQADPSAFGIAQPIGGRIVKIPYGQCEIRDSYALVPKPLASWEKDKIDIRKLLKHRREANRLEIIRYLKGDLRGLHSMLDNFFRRYGRHLTLASTAIKQLETRFGTKIPKFSERDDRWFRKFYFAGRVQFWSLGRHDGDFRIYDINSAFPWAMAKSHWFTAKGWTEGEGWPRTNREQSFYYIECDSVEALPMRGDDKSVNFPNTRIKAFVTGWELLAGLKLGRIRNIKVNWHWKPNKLRSFKRYVNYYYKRKAAAKAKGDKAEEYFNKLMLNALYGVFAINPRNFREVAIRPYYKPPIGKDGKEAPGWEQSYSDREAGLTFYQRPARNVFDRFRNVCISASITGCVRAFLLDAIHHSNPIYCDTDSLITLKAPRNIGKKLGQWKLEGRFDVVWIGAKKVYAAHKADHPWRKKRGPGSPKAWVRVKGKGWAFYDDREKDKSDFKIALKGARLKIADLIAVCEGRERKGRFDAPSYSPFRATTFTTRTIRRADKR